jgi:hypothetical protein
MGKYTIKDIEFEVDVPLDIDKRRTFELSADTFAELKQAGRDLQQQIADEFGVNVERVSVKRKGMKDNKFLIY